MLLKKSWPKEERTTERVEREAQASQDPDYHGDGLDRIGPDHRKHPALDRPQRRHAPCTRTRSLRSMADAGLHMGSTGNERRRVHAVRTGEQDRDPEREPEHRI